LHSTQQEASKLRSWTYRNDVANR